MDCHTYLTAAGNDYSTMSGELLFQPEVSNQPQCADIPIFNDETLETNEFFLVVLVNESVSVDLSQNVTAVTILDDDSKCINQHCSYTYLLCTD